MHAKNKTFQEKKLKNKINYLHGPLIDDSLSYRGQAERTSAQEDKHLVDVTWKQTKANSLIGNRKTDIHRKLLQLKQQ